MKRKSPQLGKLGTAFFALAHIRQFKVVRLGDLQKPLKLNPSQEQQLLKRLTTSGFIIRLTRGVFLVPDKIPPGGYWQPSGYCIVKNLMVLYNAKYYIGGMSAIHFHHLTTQIPNEITVYNNKINGRKTIGVQRLYFIKTESNRLDGAISMKIKNEDEIFISSLARTILDAVQNWRQLGTLPEAYHWIAQNIKEKNLINDLIRLTAEHANIITMRRIGYYLTSAGIKSTRLQPILKRLTSSTGWVKLDPNQPSKGKTNKQWRVIDNAKKL